MLIKVIRLYQTIPIEIRIIKHLKRRNNEKHYCTVSNI
jgi:hypothetical protein